MNRVSAGSAGGCSNSWLVYVVGNAHAHGNEDEHVYEYEYEYECANQGDSLC
jgi:hypothetical protein